MFPYPVLPAARLRLDGAVWIDETFPRDTIGEMDAETYDQRSRTFDLARALDRKRPPFADPLRALGKDAVILEVAAGRAAHSLALLQEGHRVIVSDVSQGSVRWAAEAAKRLGIDARGTFAVLDALHLPFPDASVDGVFLTASLHHFSSPLLAMCEFRRVLRAGGVLLVGYEPAKWSYRLFKPLWDSLKRVLRRHSPHAVSCADDATEGFTMADLRRLAWQAHFVEARVEAVDFLEKLYEHAVVLVRKFLRLPDSEYRPGSRYLRQVDRFLARVPLLKRLAWNYDMSARVPLPVHSSIPQLLSPFLSTLPPSPSERGSTSRA